MPAAPTLLLPRPRPSRSADRAQSTLPRRRDAAQTRRLLLRAARHRFALQGYAATTVREIADDVGVNAALISRYFDSKEGLFEECLTGVSTELGATAPATTLDEVALRMAEQLTGPSSAEHPNQLVLLLRSSGDERAEQIRFETLRTYAVRLADVAEAATGGGDGPARAAARAQGPARHQCGPRHRPAAVANRPGAARLGRDRPTSSPR